MNISLPKDVIKLTHARNKSCLKAFRFSATHWRAVVPHEIIDTFPKLGCDIFVSPKEKCAYLTFDKPEKTQFCINQRNGYMSCKKLFEWCSNAESPIHDNYQYEDYQADKKNKIVKLNLQRI